MIKKIIFFLVFFQLGLFSKELEKVSLQLHWKFQFESAGFIAAKEKGFYKDAGLDVEIRELKEGINVEKEVISRRATYGVYSSSIFLSYLKGKPIKLLASFFKRSAAVILAKPEIKSPVDLIGKKIMAGNEKDFTLRFRHMFDVVGVNINDLILLKHTYNVEDFAEGKVDAMSAFISDEPYKLDKLGIKYNIINPGDYGVYNLLMELFTSKYEAENHPERTEKFKKASIKGWEYALSHKKEIIDIIHKKYRPDLDRDTLENEAMYIEKLILPFAYDVGSIDINFLKKQLKQAQKYYNLKSHPPIDKYIFTLKSQNENTDYLWIFKIAAIFLIIIIYICYKHKQLKEYNEELQKINAQLHLKKTELQNQIKKNKKLVSTMENKIKREIEKGREKDRQMVQQSRLAQMGEMLSMIAHQWRQPLSAISNTANALILKAKLNKIDKELIIQHSNKILEYTLYLSTTIDDFRNFFRPDKNKEETNYKEIIDSVLSITETSLKNKNIKIIKKLNCKSSFITYKNELKQVVLNIIKNAEDILLENQIKEPVIIIETSEKDGYKILEISDNGGGIPEYLLDKIFDPYFSTKSQKNGTGLGLYMSKIIIEEHCKGKITAKNRKINKEEKINEYFMIKGISNNYAVFTIKLR